jgi:DNA-directed RNA polymerase subunit K/omega
MRNKIEDLRNHLFATLEALQDEEKPMDIDRARAIADVAKVIVDSAKVEVDFVKATGNDMASGFLPIAQQDQRPPLALKRGA